MSYLIVRLLFTFLGLSACTDCMSLGSLSLSMVPVRVTSPLLTVADTPGKSLVASFSWLSLTVSDVVVTVPDVSTVDTVSALGVVVVVSTSLFSSLSLQDDTVSAAEKTNNINVPFTMCNFITQV